jgi:hypothetical protein
MTKIKEPKPITFAEVMKKLEELRMSTRMKKVFTPQMDELLLSARTGGQVVSYRNIQILWEQAGWGHVAQSTLAVRLDELKKKAN